MTMENEVREASRRFYMALTAMAKGQAGPMSEVWAHDAEVTTMHPIGGREVGWDAVRASFEGVAGVATEGKVELVDQRIQVAGDMAFEIGTESGQIKMAGESVTIAQRVTNVYRRVSGAWKMVHHHADLSPSMIDLLARLQKK